MIKKLFRIFLLILIAAVIIGTFYWLWSKSQPKVVMYEIVEVEKGDIQNISVATGKVSPRDEILIKPQIPGIISELRKEAGDLVRSGDVIAVVKVIPEMSSLNQAESRVRLAEISFKQVESEYERQKQLYERGVISADEMERSEVEYRRAVEEVEVSIDNLQIVREGVSRRTEQLSNTQIRSTINGMILDIPVKVGNSVIQANNFNDGTTIATVADMNDMLFIGTVDETEVGRVHTGMPMKLTIGALEGFEFDAVLEYISPMGTEENGAITFEIKAAATIPDTVTVRAGYSANARIVLERVENVLAVPEAVLEFANDSTFVHVLTDSIAIPQLFERRPVETGLTDGIRIEVTKGLSEGEKLRGNEKTDK